MKNESQHLQQSPEKPQTRFQKGSLGGFLQIETIKMKDQNLSSEKFKQLVHFFIRFFSVF